MSNEAKGPYTTGYMRGLHTVIDGSGVVVYSDDTSAGVNMFADAANYAHHQALTSQAARVKELEDREGVLLDALEACRINDRSKPYEYGEKRKLDEAVPPKGQRWNTPFEISRDAIGEWAKRVFGKSGVQSLASASALTPKEPQQ